MARYADVEKIENLLVRGIDECGDAIVSLRDVRRAMAQAKNDDVQEVRHGMWVLPQKKGCLTYDESAYKECSECGEVTFLAKTKYGQMNYCPNCGAKMDRKE